MEVGHPRKSKTGGTISNRLGGLVRKRTMQGSRLIGRVEKKTYAGVILKREFFTVAPVLAVEESNIIVRLRFKSEEERKAHRDHISRQRHVLLVNENFRPGDLYLTLTFNRKNECHSYADAKKLTVNYIRRVRRVCKNAVIFWYIGRGENTKRYHVHILASGAPEHIMVSKWGMGEIVDVSKLWDHVFYDGVDHGADYTGLANYLFDHWEPEQGPHRYHHTRNAGKPTVEAFRASRRKYTVEHPPAAPKGYKLVSSRTTDYGYQCFTYVREPRKTFLDPDHKIRKPKRSRKRRTQNRKE